jgi:hypothetical protein
MNQTKQQPSTAPRTTASGNRAEAYDLHSETTGWTVVPQEVVASETMRFAAILGLHAAVAAYTAARRPATLTSLRFAPLKRKSRPLLRRGRAARTSTMETAE